jgi:Flp pilus assembly pilin Flp
MIEVEGVMSCFRAPLAALLTSRVGERGQSMVDYAVLMAVVIAAIAVAYKFLDLAQLIQTVFNSVTAALE